MRIRRREFLSLLGAAAVVSGRIAKAGSRQPHAWLRTNWLADPYARGSYSYIARNSSRRDHSALQAPVTDRLYFAGEAAHPLRNSTVHAAYESGLMAARAVSDTRHRSIAVIGAGISGLAAAHRIHQDGRQVTVLEARQRVGGRIWTDRTTGRPLDMGASWLHGDSGNPLAPIATSLSLPQAETDESYILRGEDGREKHDWPAWLEEVSEVQHSAGADLSDLNLSAYARGNDYGGRELIFPDGYDQIFDALDGEYELVTGVTVQQVKYHQNGVHLQARDGRSADFDAVIVTVPLGVLKVGSIAFDPALPDWKQDAINRLGFGLLDKVYLIFDDAFWDDEQWVLTPENGLPRGQFNQWLNLNRTIGAPVLVAFNGSGPARDLSTLPDREVLRRAVQAIEGAYPA